MAHICILGGDGYLGWPSAMYFSDMGHDVTIVDNYLRRNLCRENGIDFLYPVPDIAGRIRLWEESGGKKINYAILDLTDPEKMRGLFSKESYEACCGAEWPGLPHAVLHYAEQPSAPFSLKDFKATLLTVDNNLSVTTNLLCALRDLSPATQLVHIGTMGEYGTPNIDIEEGWLEIEHKGRKDKFLFPRQASSVYHTTKIMDTDLMWYFVRAFKLAATDLMQGPVYGIETAQSARDTALRPYFNYDFYFGTVINRFVVQAVAGYPLTIYGAGGQTRGYININDTLQCVAAAVARPARAGELRIFNQITETFSVMELAERIKRAGNHNGLKVEIAHVPNPRIEAEEHYYNPTYTGLRELGVQLHPLDDIVLGKMLDIAHEYIDNIKIQQIMPGN